MRFFLSNHYKLDYLLKSASKHHLFLSEPLAAIFSHFFAVFERKINRLDQFVYGTKMVNIVGDSNFIMPVISWLYLNSRKTKNALE